jgi:hypothetical protein
VHPVPGVPQYLAGGPRELAEGGRMDDDDRAGLLADDGGQLADRAGAHDHLVGHRAADADPGQAMPPACQRGALEALRLAHWPGPGGGPAICAATSAAISSGARPSVVTVIRASFW